MAGISGKDGKVEIGGLQVAEITKWSFNTTSNNASWASSDTAGYKTRVVGSKDGSGSMEGKLDPDVGIPLEVGDEPVLTLRLDDTHYYTVYAVVDSFDLEVDIDDGDVVGWSADFSIRVLNSTTPPWLYT